MSLWTHSQQSGAVSLPGESSDGVEMRDVSDCSLFPAASLGLPLEDPQPRQTQQIGTAASQDPPEETSKIFLQQIYKLET